MLAPPNDDLPRGWGQTLQRASDLFRMESERSELTDRQRAVATRDANVVDELAETLAYIANFSG